MTNYILLPSGGLFGSNALADFFSSKISRPTWAGKRNVKIIDSIHEDGPKLVEMDEIAAREVNKSKEVRALPLVRYLRSLPEWKLRKSKKAVYSNAEVSCASSPLPRPKVRPASGKVTPEVIVAVKLKGANVGVNGALVIAFTDFENRVGVTSVTDKNGQAYFKLPFQNIERIYCAPPFGYWSAFRKDVPVDQPITLDIEKVDPEFIDCVRFYYGGPSKFNKDAGVIVGVIDSGVGPHDDLNVIGGRNTITGEDDNDYRDVGFHGTHVAGLIGSKGQKHPKLRGIAPWVRIQSYRAFGFDGTATNYAIMKALIFAVDDKCDVMNLSIEDGPYDEVLLEAITDARENGILVVVSAGNDGRRAVNYPAAYPGATAVSAMGREGTFPVGCLDESYVVRPPTGESNFAKEFIAEFSNVGPQVAVTAPGVGILSTLSFAPYCSPLSGTSMAAPVVAGAAASLLSQRKDIFDLPRNGDRSKAIEKLLFENCISMGFGEKFEGHGMPDPSKV